MFDGSTSVSWRRLRLRFRLLLVKMWLRLAFWRLIAPDPVILNRFFAPEFVFIFGITTPLRIVELLLIWDHHLLRLALVPSSLLAS